MAKYKPGQFVKVNIPGKYRVNIVLNLTNACTECDIRKECFSYSLQQRYLFAMLCTAAIGLRTNIKKVE